MNKTEALKMALAALEYHTVQTRPIAATEAAITAIKEVLAETQPEHSATYQKINLSLLQHSDKCRFWDDGDLCTCGAIEFHELQFWKNKALAQPEQLIQVKFWSVTGKFERQAFASLSGAEAYCKGLNTTHPEGGYIVRPLLETPEPKREWVGLTHKEIMEIDSTYYRLMGPLEFAKLLEAKLKELNHD